MVDMVFLVFTAFPYLPWGWMKPEFSSEDFLFLLSGWWTVVVVDIFQFPVETFFQKKRDVHKISARNSGAGNGCADFIGAWHFLVLSAGKPHAHKIPP